MNNLNLADLTCEPIIAKKAQDAENIGVCKYLSNQLLQSITPENMSAGIQRLFNIKKYEDSFLTSWQDDYNNLNKISEVMTAILRDCSRYNSKFSYNKYGLSTIALVHYLSKNQQNREQDAEIDNNPLTDNGTYWSRGIKDTDLLSQRFNLWNVSMTNTTITLTSTTEFSDYLFTANQLKNGLKISFIPTQDGTGYDAGDSYTITIDGVSKKLFENEDETTAGSGSVIVSGKLLQIYYNANGDGGNGAFYVVKTGGSGSGEREVGTMFFSMVPPAGLDENPPRVFELNTTPDDDPIDLTLYPDLRVFAVDLEVRYPSLFVDRQTWISTYNSTKFGQCPFFCWGNANKQSIYLPSIKDVTGKGTPFTVQKQEVPTGTMTAMTLINYMQLDGAFTASGEDGYTGGNGFTEIRGRNFTYDPQKAGDNTFNANGSDNKIEAIVGRWYIQAVAPKTPMPTLFDFKGSVSSVQDLPQASSNKSNIYLVDNATDGGLYLSDGSTWNLIMEPASIVNLTSLVNRVATLESLPHIIYSNYTVKPYYEVLSNGMCRQWSMADPSDTSSAYTTDTTFSFAIPYKNTGYLLKNVGFDVRNVGEQLVTLSTTGFTTSSLRTASGTRCWEAYGEVDLEQISDYIL